MLPQDLLHRGHTSYGNRSFSKCLQQREDLGVDHAFNECGRLRLSADGHVHHDRRHLHAVACRYTSKRPEREVCGGGGGARRYLTFFLKHNNVTTAR